MEHCTALHIHSIQRRFTSAWFPARGPKISCTNKMPAPCLSHHDQSQQSQSDTAVHFCVNETTLLCLADRVNFEVAMLGVHAWIQGRHQLSGRCGHKVVRPLGTCGSLGCFMAPSEPSAGQHGGISDLASDILLTPPNVRKMQKHNATQKRLLEKRTT